MSCTFTCWSSLPAELRLAVIDHVDPTTLLSLSATSKITRTQCVQRLFKSITIACFPALQDFVACMPTSHLNHVRELNISTSDAPQSCQRCAPSSAHSGKGTPRSDTLARVLSGTPLLERLDLRLSGGLAPKVVPCFRALQRLTTLSLENCDDEDKCPLSETVVVGVALAAPQLSSLSLTRITRSRQYAGDILPISSYAASIPLVCNDEPIPAGQQPLSLPSLLTIPTLRHLSIHDTHLGDARFASADLDVRCALESLEIGTYAGSPPSESASWTARILERVAPDLKHLACGAGLPDIPPPSPFPSPAALHLPRLRSVRFTPFMSPLMIPSTLSSIAAAGSTVEDLDVECLQDDIEDVVDELLTFVNDATAAGSCPFNHVRLHVREDLDSSPRAPIANAAALDEDCSRSVRKLGGACDRAGVRVSLLGAELDPTVIQAASDMDWDSDDTAVDGHVGDELDKAATGRVVDVDVEMLEEDAWARFGGW